MTRSDVAVVDVKGTSGITAHGSLTSYLRDAGARNVTTLAMSAAASDIVGPLAAPIGDRNVVKLAVEPDHPDYAKLKGVPPKGSPGGGNSGAPAQAAPAYAAPTPQRAPVTGKPSWAQ